MSRKRGHPDEPVEELDVVRYLRGPRMGKFVEVVSRSPPSAHLGQLFAPFALGLRPRVVGQADPLHSRVEEDEAGTASG